MPEGVEGGGLGCVGSLGIDWYITDKYKVTYISSNSGLVLSKITKHKMLLFL